MTTNKMLLRDMKTMVRDMKTTVRDVKTTLLRTALLLLLLLGGGMASEAWATDYINVMLGKADANGKRKVTAKFVRTDTNYNGQLENNQQSRLVTQYHYWKTATDNGDGTFTVDESSDNQIPANQNRFTYGGNRTVCYVTYDYDETLFTDGYVYRICIKNNSNFMYASTSGVLNSDDGTYTDASLWTITGDPYSVKLHPYSQPSQCLTATDPDGNNVTFSQFADKDASDSNYNSDNGYCKTMLKADDGTYTFNTFMLVRPDGGAPAIRLNQYAGDGTAMGSAQNAATTQFPNWFGSKNQLRFWREWGDSRIYFVRANAATGGRRTFHIQNENGDDEAQWQVLANNTTASLTLDTYMKSPFATNYQYWADAAHTKTTAQSSVYGGSYFDLMDVYVTYDYNTSVFNTDKTYKLRLSNQSGYHYLGAADGTDHVVSTTNLADATTWTISGTPYRFRINSKTNPAKFLTVADMNNNTSVYQKDASLGYDYFQALYRNGNGLFGIMVSPGTSVPVIDSGNNTNRIYLQQGTQLGVSTWNQLATYGPADAEFILANTVSYHIVTLDRSKVAITYTGDSDNDAFGLPDHMKSPLAADFRYWKTQTTDGSGKHVLSDEVSSYADLAGATEVWVTYTYDATPSEDKIDLNGNLYYSIHVSNNYIYDNGTGNKVGGNNTNHYDYQSKAQWLLTGQDPYDITILSRNTPSYKLTKTNTSATGGDMYLRSSDVANTIQRFILLRNPSYPSNYELMGAYTPTGGSTNYFYLQTGIHMKATADAQSGAPAVQIQLKAFRDFHIIRNDAGDVAIEGAFPSSGTGLTVPSEIRSPLIADGDYTFYSNLADATSGSTPLENLWGQKDIYIRYTYHPESSPVDLDGGTYYTFKFTDGNRYVYDYLDNGNRRTRGEASIASQNRTLQDRFHWYFTGNDPYYFEVHSRINPERMLSKRAQNGTTMRPTNETEAYIDEADATGIKLQHFMLTQHSGLDTYQLMAVYPYAANNLQGRFFYYRDVTNNWFEIRADANIQAGHSQLQFQLDGYRAYHIIRNDSGDEAISQNTVASPTLAVPEEIRSPLIWSNSTNSYYGSSSYTYYGSLADAQAQANALSTAAGNKDIYVRYTYDPTASPVDISGNTWYTWHLSTTNGDRWVRSVLGDISQRAYMNSSVSAVDINRQNFLWKFTGNDPYHVEIYNRLFSDNPVAISQASYTNNEQRDLWLNKTDATMLHHFIFTQAAGKSTYQMMMASRPTEVDWSSLAIYLRNNANNYPYFGASNSTAQQHGYDYIQFQLEPYVTYHVIDGQGEEAVHYTTAKETTPQIPRIIKSVQVPYENFTYYATRADAVSGTNPISSTTGLTDIYVRYTYNAAESPIDISGTKYYNIRFYENRYLYSRGNYTTSGENRPWLNDNPPSATIQADAYQWLLTGDDPYRIEVVNKAQPGYVFARNDKVRANSSDPRLYGSDPSTHLQRFIITQAEGKSTYQMMGAYNLTEIDNNSSLFFYWRDYNNNQPCITGDPSYQDGHNLVQLQFVSWGHYQVVNTLGEVAIDGYHVVGGELDMMPELKTPYMPDDSSYKFFRTQAEAAAYTRGESDGSAAVTQFSQTDGTNVYVGYQYDPSTRPSTLPALDGSLRYYIQGSNSSGSLYYYTQNSVDGRPTNKIGIKGSGSLNVSDYTYAPDMFQWLFHGNDPYHIIFSNCATGKYVTCPFGTNDWGADFVLEETDENAIPLVMLNDGNGGCSMVYRWKEKYQLTSYHAIIFFGINITTSNVGQLVSLNTNPATLSYVYTTDDHYVHLTFPTPDPVYVIVNNKGRKAFRWDDSNATLRVLDGQYGVKTPLARDYRFYTSLADAQADAAAGTRQPSALEVGDAAQPGTVYYVRYSLADDPAFDLTGRTYYSIDVTTDSRHLQYAAKNDYVNTTLSTTEGDAYHWAFKAEGDPYDIHLVNTLGVSNDTGYQLTARAVNNSNGKLTDNKTSYAYYDAANNDDQSAATMDLQSFYFTQSPGKSTWQLVGAYNGFLYHAGNPGHNHAGQRYFLNSDTGSSSESLNLYVKRQWNQECGSNNVQLTITPLPEKNYIFHIINNQGDEALQASAENLPVGAPINSDGYLPQILRSPLVGEYAYYTDAACTNEIISLPISGSNTVDIYVRYTVDDDASIDLLGNTRYRMRVYNRYAIATQDWQLSTTAQQGDDTDHHAWQLDANGDPYDIRLHPAGSSAVALGCASPLVSGSAVKLDGSDVVRFALLYGKDDSTSYSLAAAMGDAVTDNLFAYVSLPATSLQLLRGVDYTPSLNQMQVYFEPIEDGYYYHIINRQGRQALTYKVTVPKTDAYTLNLPNEVRALGATNFKYYTSSDFDTQKMASGIYQLSGGSHTPLTVLNGNSGISDIYVLYDLTPSVLTSQGFDGEKLFNIQLAGTSWLSYDNTNATLGAEATITGEETNYKNLFRIEANGNDPYDVALYSFYDATTPLGASNYGQPITIGGSMQGFILMGQGTTTSPFELLVQNSTQMGEVPLGYLTLDGSGPPRLVRDAARQHEDGSDDPVRIALTVKTLAPVTYFLYDLQGEPVMEGQNTSPKSIAPELPDYMQSPLVQTYHFWQDVDCTVPLTNMDDAVGKIYVTYDPVVDSRIDLSGTAWHSLFANSDKNFIVGQYNGSRGEALHFYSYYSTYSWRPLVTRQQKAAWQLKAQQVNGGYDPYNVVFYLVGYGRHWMGSSVLDNDEGHTNNIRNGNDIRYRKMLLKGKNGYIEIADLIDGSLKYLESSGFWQREEMQRVSNGHGNVRCQFFLQPCYTYRIINLSGTKSVDIGEERPVLENITTPLLPTIMQSRLVTKYRYYDASQVTESNGVYTLIDGARELDYVSNTTQNLIYVFYDRQSITDDIDFTAQTSYNIYNPTNNYYLYNSSDNNVGKSLVDDPDSETLNEKAYVWKLGGGDPYAFHIYNINYNYTGTETSPWLSGNNGYSSNNIGVKLLRDNNRPLNTFMLVNGMDGNSFEMIPAYIGQDETPASLGYYHYYELSGDQNRLHYADGYFHNRTSLQLALNPKDTSPITYVVINKAGDEAIRMTVESTLGIAPEIPDAIRSPYANYYKYYDGKNSSTEVTEVQAGQTIYVRDYTVDLSSLDLDLTGTKSYNLWVNGQYAKASEGSIVAEEDPEHLNIAPMEWTVTATDPYDVTLTNVSDGTLINTTKYILMNGSQSGNLELLAATGAATVVGDENHLAYLRRDGSTVVPASYNADISSGMAEVQVRLLPVKTKLTYHIIDLSGREAIQYTWVATSDELSAASLEVPAAIKSPLCTGWRYWNDYDPDTGEVSNEMASIPHDDDEIYVTYQYDTSTADAIDLYGHNFYNLQVDGNYLTLQTDDDTDATSLLADSSDQPTVAQANGTDYLWGFYAVGENDVDPYAIHIVNKGDASQYVGAAFNYDTTGKSTLGLSAANDDTAETTYILVGSSVSGPFELVAASGGSITDNVLTYAALDDGDTQPSLLRRDDTQTGSPSLQVLLSQPGNEYIYKVYNLSGQLAIQATAAGNAGEAPVLPSIISSPLVSEFHYWQDETLTTPMQLLPVINGEGTNVVYVTYDFDESRLMQPNLLGQKSYNMKVGGQYYAVYSGTSVNVAAVTTETATNYTDDGGTWHVDGNLAADNSYEAPQIDPYDIRLLALDDGTSLTAVDCAAGQNALKMAATADEGELQSFILLGRTDGNYELMCATGDRIQDNVFAYLGRDVSNVSEPQLVRGAIYAKDMTSIKVELVPFKHSYTYVVINNSLCESVRYTTEADEGDFPLLPDVLRTPLIDIANYSYYPADQVTVESDGQYVDVFALNEGATEMTVLPADDDILIYVRYRYVPTENGLDLSGAVKYNIYNPNGDSKNYMRDNGTGIGYRLKRDINPVDVSQDRYLFRLENGDPYYVKIRSVHFPDGVAQNIYRRYVGLETYTMDLQKETYSSDEYWFTQHYMLLGHSDGDYRLLGVTPETWRDSRDGQAGAKQYTYLPINSISGDEWKPAHHNRSTGPGGGLRLIFSPATYHNYRLHLTTHIKDREYVVENPNTAVNSVLELPDILKRKYCVYPHYYYYVGSDGLPRTQSQYEEGDEDITRMDITEDMDANGILFYPLVAAVDAITDDNLKANTWVDIYVEYEVQDMPFNLMATDKTTVNALLNNTGGWTDMVFNLSSYERLTEKIFTNGTRARKDFLYFMVLNTNNDYSGGSQYFLKRNDNGRIAWLQSEAQPHYSRSQNINNWDYSRCAESYRPNDHAPFEEKHWLWAFAGDPYDMYIYNVSAVMEETYDAIAEETDIVVHREHITSWRRLSTSEVAAYTPDYTVASPPQYCWGLADGRGSNSDETFSIVAGQTDADGNLEPTNENGQLLFWKMKRSNRDNAEEVLLQPRSADFTGLDYNIRVLPYEPHRYEDVNLVIRRDDNIFSDPNAVQGAGQANTHKYSDLQPQKTGISQRYYAAKDRKFVAGDDKITSDVESIPFELRRQFCQYTVYSDVYDVVGDYTIQAGPYRDNHGHVYALDGQGQTMWLKADGTVAANEEEAAHVAEDGTIAGLWPQSVYMEYKVTSDIFLKQHPTKDEVEQMVANNDHVYFMDFTDNLTQEGYNRGHHAYFNEEATFEPQVTGGATEKRRWNKNIGDFEDDNVQRYNFCQYQTTANRMETVPENLKWYFVGDPYHVQVYCTKDEFNKIPITVTDPLTDETKTYEVGTLGNNLCRFDPTESRFQFVVDCVHLRMPTDEVKDQRQKLTFHDQLTNEVLGEIDNPNYQKPYYQPFYWEVVPALSDREGSFALRFKADNPVVGYRNIYYYLAHDGISRDYKESINENRKKYRVNLSYTEDNDLLDSKKYVGYHAANGTNCVIHLVQPAKLYVTACKDGSDDPVVKEELSEYFGVGETLYDVPRHLKRKYVKYSGWAYQNNNSATWHDITGTTFSFTLDADKTSHAYNMEDCDDTTVDGHTFNIDSWMFTYNGRLLDGTVPKKRASYKLRVHYELDDETRDGIHLFTTDVANPQWLDVKVGSSGNSGWLYYEKGKDTDPQPTLLSNFSYNQDQKSGWDTGLKGLHWAFVGDPYEFKVVNRRRWEDMCETSGTGNCFWLGTGYACTKEDVTRKTREYDNETGEYSIKKETLKGQDVWYNYGRLGDDDTNNPYGRNGDANTGNTGNGNTTWSLIYCKTGGAGDAFMRTASRKTADTGESDGFGANVGDYPNNHPGGNMTNDYERLMAKNFKSSDETAKSGFVTVPFTLETTTNEIQKVDIRTAVARDNDRADNDCFDANVYIYDRNHQLKAYLKHVEVKYDDVFEAIPYTLRRYGCDYVECWLNNIDQEDPQSVKIADVNNGLSAEFNEETLAQATPMDIDGNVWTPGSCKKYYDIAYVYTVNDEVAPFFTSQEDANEDEYTWANSYYKWYETVDGAGKRVVTYEDVFDHYIYSADGHIIDEVYRKVERVTYTTGKDTWEYYGWVDSHQDDNTHRAYANETSQNNSDQMKWAFVGDPYDFQLKNYAEYLDNPKSGLTSDASGIHSTTSTSAHAHWALALGEPAKDKQGNTLTDSEGNTVYNYYLALINDEDGTVLQYATFDRSKNGKDLADADQYLKLEGGVYDEPTGNSYNVNGVKPYHLADLISYANTVIYHLVIAHQHSRSPEDLDELTAAGHYDKDVWLTIDNGQYDATKAYTVIDHLAEWDWYNNRIDEKAHADYPLTNDEVDALGTKYVKPSSLRDVISDPIDDYSVQRVGIGNRLNVPWYMKRQFCNYDLYQRDVMRSVTLDGTNGEPAQPDYYTNDDGLYTDRDGNVLADQSQPVQRTFVENGVEKLAYKIRWESVLTSWDGTSDKPRGYDDILQQNGHIINKLDDSHRNRMVVIDVVYHVNPDEFRFADKGRNTTAWYSMMTNNPKDGLMNFSYKDGIGARHGREEHYTNNYLWAPEGDPYGFILHSRYATINGTGWDNVVVTSADRLPSDGDTSKDKLQTIDYNTTYSAGELLAEKDVEQLGYTGHFDKINFRTKRITHPGRNADRKTWSARNAVYEMYAGDMEHSFLMHPTAAYINTSGDKFSSFYVIHNTTPGSADYHKAELKYVGDVKDIRANNDANWRLYTTPEQLLPYFKRAGYVGGLKPTVANHFENISLYNKLQEYKATYQTDPSVIDFSVMDKARELVYGGRFYRRGGEGNPYTTELLYTEERPKDNSDDMPLRFVSNNLVPLTKGYYRIEAFSRKALDADGANLDGTGIQGIQGPRFISGYRHKSEMDYEGYAGGTLTTGSRWLHFIETDEEHTSIRNFGELNAKIQALEGSSHYERDIEPHPAMRGNIEILPAEYDPASIFHFVPMADDDNDRFTVSTQGLYLQGEVTDENTGKTSLTTGEGAPFRINDIGGTAVTMRLRKYAVGDELLDADGNRTGTMLNTWDDAVAQNLKTNYLCIDANHRYRVTIHKDNEMKEIGDSYATGDDYWDIADINYGIQDTKWLLKPVGTQTAWPYNEMPLRLRVNEGGQKADTQTGLGMEGEENKDQNYYASLYVPFDARLSKTIDVAFTSIKVDPQPKKLTLSSVSQLNNMGNPQFIPAGWPVVVRTSKPVTTIVCEDGSVKASRWPHVDLFLPTNEPTSIPDSKNKIKLWGEYLEQELTDERIDEQTGVSTWSQGRNVMVFGLPFVEGENDKTTYGEQGSAKSYDWYDYNSAAAVGFYTNENWWSGHYATSQNQDTENTGLLQHAFLATERNATDQQRSNRYVRHNRIYYVYDWAPSAGGARPTVTVFFGDEELPGDDDDDHPIGDDVTGSGDPWPCDVYDLQGRRVAEQETPQTLRHNHPSLRPGVYIFGGRKVVVR